jgi:hypothetical protein
MSNIRNFITPVEMREDERTFRVELEEYVSGTSDSDSFDIIDFKDVVEDYPLVVKDPVLSVQPMQSLSRQIEEFNPVTLQEINDLLDYVSSTTKECLEEIAKRNTGEHCTREGPCVPYDSGNLDDGSNGSSSSSVDASVKTGVDKDLNGTVDKNVDKNSRSNKNDHVNTDDRVDKKIQEVLVPEGTRKKRTPLWGDKLKTFLMNDVWYLGTDVVIPMSIFTVMSYVTMQLSEGM